MSSLWPLARALTSWQPSPSQWEHMGDRSSCGYPGSQRTGRSQSCSFLRAHSIRNKQGSPSHFYRPCPCDVITSHRAPSFKVPPPANITSLGTKFPTLESLGTCHSQAVPGLQVLGEVWDGDTEWRDIPSPALT